MENASKALIIAGAILIAILIVSLGVMVFQNFGEKAKEAANMDKQEIANFNSKITPYLGENVSGSQVNALIQYITSVNISAINNEDSIKNVKITFPTNGDGTNTNSIEVKNNGGTLQLSYGNENLPKKVPTGTSIFYNVKESYASNGLINKITVAK